MLFGVWGLKRMKGGGWSAVTDVGVDISQRSVNDIFLLTIFEILQRVIIVELQQSQMAFTSFVKKPPISIW